jgi:hypothetical protein
MNYEAVIQELESLGNERMKKIYIRNGAREPLFGVATGAMKPLAKKSKKTSHWPISYTAPATTMPCILPASFPI